MKGRRILTMSHQTENSNKEVEITKKSQMKILELQSLVTEVKKKKKSTIRGSTIELS